jgi:tetratricopeptide (TPR) repeat protein
VEISLLDDKRSMELFMKESARYFDALPVQEKEAAKAVVKQLGGLPLAIEIAGAYLAHISACTFHQYKTILEENLKAALDGNMLSSCTKHECDLFATLKVSESLLAKSPLLKEIIDFLAWSSSAFTGISLVAAVLDRKEPELIQPLSLGVTLKILQKSGDGTRYDLHRLVRKVQQEQYPIAGRSEWVDMVCLRLGKWFEDRRKEFKKLPEFEAEFDHLKEWLGHAQSLFPVHAARLTWLQANLHYHWGKYSESYRLVQSAFSMLGNINDLDLKLKADILNDLGTTSSLLGKYTVAFTYHQQALDIRLKQFGGLHPGIADSYNNIGSNLDAMGNHNEALQKKQKALSIRLQLFGEQHPATAMSYNNIGYTYGKMGNHEEALKYLEKALAIFFQLFGEQHPDTAMSYDGVGVTLDAMGKHEDALKYKEKALSIRLQLFGEQHPATATSYNNIGYTYGEMRKHEEALQKKEKALSIRLQLFGEQHPATAKSYDNIGYTYKEMKKYEEALQKKEKALSIRLQLFGEQHQDTTNSAKGIIHCLIKLNRLPEASERLGYWLDILPTDHIHYKKLEEMQNSINSEKRKV